MQIKELQANLKKYKLDGYIVTRNNMFLGQDIRDDENIIYQLTNFSGSAGTLLILPHKSILFVDGRYELQAPQEVDNNLVEVICTKTTSFNSWLNQNMQNKKIGYHPWAHSCKWLKYYSHLDLVAETNFLPLILSPITSKVFEHDIKFSGESRENKINLITSYLKDNKLDACFLASAENISWLFNLRSNALPKTPIFRGMALIYSNGETQLFADNIELDIQSTNLTFYSLADLHKHLKKQKNKKLGYIPSSSPIGFIDLAENFQIKLSSMPDLCSQNKAIKNTQELQGIRTAHIRDGVAVCKFLHWLENNWQEKTELDIVKKLHDFRSKQEHYFSESFDTIAAFGSNGAIVHYSPSEQTNKKLEKNNLLLIDSGAQYFDGTTDVTRTIAIGNLSQTMIDNFTLVLKGHINLNSATFPQHTTGKQLDILARQFLWQDRKDYNHGTGHGVGCFLNVHEGPQSISPQSHGGELQAGMITSIEPGYYLENNYGIRIENLVEICQHPDTNFLYFKNLTMIPIDKRAINKYLLSNEEVNWLNNYHQEVWNTISPYLTTSEKEWLSDACAPL